MINLGAGPALFALSGYLYWAAMLVAIVLVLLFVKKTALRAALALAVAVAFIQMPVRHVMEKEARKAELDAKREKGLAYWQERCKGAGLFIHRTVDDVEGLFVGEIPQPNITHAANQNAPDPFNWDLSGDGYIRSFLIPRNAKGQALGMTGFDPEKATRDADGNFLPESVGSPTYRWVEGIDPIDGRQYRYTLVFETINGGQHLEVRIRRQPPAKDPPRYAIRKSDISTAKDREMWVAGGSLQVIDQLTGEVLAERIGFMVDEWQGSRAASRMPWEQARHHACPAFSADDPLLGLSGPPAYQTRLFVEKAIIPSRGT